MPRATKAVHLPKLDAQMKEDALAVLTRHNENGIISTWKRDHSRIGEGGFGAVYREERIEGRSPGALGAVKVMQKLRSRTACKIDYSKELEAIARFSQLQYQQQFVRSAGWWDNSDSVFISMEYVENGDLQRWVGLCMPEAEMQLIVSQVLEGLAHMHNLNYAHRDLKPANLLVSATGPLWYMKIADLGFSKRVTEGLSSLRTQAGTRGYMAPEVNGLLDSDDSDDDESPPSYNNNVDIWALGVISYQMLTAQLPFEADDFRALKRYVGGKSPFPREVLVANNISEHGIASIRSCMSPSPDQRPGAGFSRRHRWPLGANSFVEDERPSQKPLSLDSDASASWTARDSEYAESYDKVDDPIQGASPYAFTARVSLPVQDSRFDSTPDMRTPQNTLPEKASMERRTTLPAQDSGYETIFRTDLTPQISKSSLPAETNVRNSNPGGVFGI